MKLKQAILFSSALSVGALCALAPAAHADTAVTFNPTSGNYTNTYTGTVGYAFSVSENTIVTGLDYWVDPSDTYNNTSGELSVNHIVGIYTFSSTDPLPYSSANPVFSNISLVGSTVTISKGTSATLDMSPEGGFATVSLGTPITLTAGTDYLILANTGGSNKTGAPDPFLDSLSSPQSDPASGITYLQGVYNSTNNNGGSIITGGLRVEPIGDNGYFGPDFETAPAVAPTSAVPEPSPLALLALGLPALGLVWRARRCAG